MTIFSDKKGRGSGGIGGIVSMAFLGVILLVLVANLITNSGSSIFPNATSVTAMGAPSWFNTIYPMLLGFSLVGILLVVLIFFLKKAR